MKMEGEASSPPSLSEDLMGCVGWQCGVLRSLTYCNRSPLPIVMALGQGCFQPLSTHPRPGQEAQVLLNKDLLSYV